MQNKLGFIIISFFCILGLHSLNAQTATKEQVKQLSKAKTDTIKLPVYRGFRLDLDLSPLANYFINKGKRLSYEAGLSVNLNNKYFPTVEMGYGFADKITDEGVGFTSNALFGRIGADLNLMKQPKGPPTTNNLFFAGFRVGVAPVNYSITNLSIPNDYWGTPIVTNFNKQYTLAKWYEILVGIRVEIAPKLYMGWTARLKNPIGKAKTGQVFPWYIPGYGVKTEQANFGFNYSLGYKF